MARHLGLALERAMSTREIPKAEWTSFLDSFSRQHRGWLVTVEAIGAGAAGGLQVREQPLAGISAEVRGEHARVSVLIGKAPDSHLGHFIEDAERVRLEESSAGAHEALQIDSRSGARTLLRFRSTMPIEAVDGAWPD